jgi:hypothetical protein
MTRKRNWAQTCLWHFALGCLIVSGLLLLPFQNEVMAQSTNGRMVVTVKDQTGAVISGATLTITNEGTNQQINATTNDSGNYVSPLLSVGLYTVTVEAPGFKKAISEKVKIDVGQEYGIVVQMEAGGGSEVVLVNAGEELVQTSNAEVKNVVTQKQVQELPLNGRNPLELIALQAGVNSGNLSRTTTTINGQRASSSTVTQDGINIQDLFIRTNALDFSPNRPTVAFVGEFSVTTLNPGAEAQGSSTVALVTPSGTNDFHGSAFEFHRNSAAGANSFFNNLQKVPKPQLIRNQFGYTLSGPVRIPGVYNGKDKLFFFNYYEGFRQRTGSPLTTTVFLPQARQGIFTYRDNTGAVKTLDILRLKNIPIDPFVAGILGRVPNEANDFTVGDRLNTAGLRFNRATPTTRNVTGFRFDYIATPKLKFEGVYQYADEDIARGDIDLSFNKSLKASQVATTHFFAIAANMTLTERFNNEIRVGRNFSDPDFKTSEDLSGFFTNTPLITNPVVTFLSQGRTTRINSFIDQASYSIGNHTFRFGGQFDQIRVRARNAAGTVPTINFGISTAAPSGFGLTARDFPGGIDATQLANANALLSFLGGVVSSAAVSFNAATQTSGFVKGQIQLRKLEINQFGFFVADSWRLTPRFTVNLGMRYDYISPLRESRNLALLPVPNRADGNRDPKAVVLDPNGIIDFARGGFYEPDRNNIAPNVSFAWDVPGLGRQTVIRGGYSIQYINDEAIRAADNAAIGNAGLTSSVSRTGLFGFLSRDLGAVMGLLQPPAFKVPRKYTDNLAIDPATAAFIVDPNLKTPYYQQFNLSFEREVLRDTVVTLRYVGNRSTNLVRGVDFNQVDIRNNGFLNDFLRARQNGFLALARTGVFDPRFSANIPGSQQLTVFPLLAGAGLLTNATVRSFIQSGQPGELASIYVTNRLAGGVRFTANPSVFVADVLSNGAESEYHGFQAEIRRRFSNGLQFQANYTFSKVLTNAVGDDTSQTRFEPLLDNAQPTLERARATFDVPHAFKTNFLFELPFGPGKRFDVNNSVVRKVIGGYQVSSIINVQTGTLFSILSGRGTLNRGGRSPRNTANSSLSVDEIKDLFGFFVTPRGIFYIDPKVIGPDGRGVAPDGAAPFPGQVFFNPEPGQVGSLARLEFNGPTAFTWDFSVSKRTNIGERVSTEFRAEFFNVLNHPIFFAGFDQNVNSTTFGRLTQTLNSARIIQFALKIGF